MPFDLNFVRYDKMKYSFFFVIAFIACHSSSTTSLADSLQSKQDSSLAKSLRIIEDDSAPNTFRIHFPQNAIEVAFKGVLNSPERKQTYIFYAKEGKILDAEIIPDTSVANIRFNQIFSPDGGSDGPFGLTIHYALNKTGDYRVVIAESLMAEPWTGKYIVHLKIK